jgi:TrmH family RNA methyltransferase
MMAVMLSAMELDQFVVVLVRARNPSNIGAVARAMYDFGFTRLRIVNEYVVPFEAAKSAIDASSVLMEAENFESVAAAVADCTQVVGTTAVGKRVLEHPLEALPEAMAKMQAHLLDTGEKGRVALLFGSEKTGLSNEELSHCGGLLTIPMAEHAGARHPSMNLGQAVAVCLYEVVRQRGFTQEAVTFPGSTGVSGVASVGELERVGTLLHEVLEKGEYMRHHPANSEVESIRRLVVRMKLTGADATIWMGILRQLLWRISKS